MSETNELTLPGGVSIEGATEEFSKCFAGLQQQCIAELGYAPELNATKDKSLLDIPFGDCDGQWQPAATYSVKATYLGEPNDEQRAELPNLFALSGIAAAFCAKDLAGCFRGGASDYLAKGQAKGHMFQLAYRVEIKEEDPIASDPTNPLDPMDPFSI